MSDILRIALAQIAPVWFDREKTLIKVFERIAEAADNGCDLVAFGEALVPGYPFWLEYSNVIAFNSPFHVPPEFWDIDCSRHKAILTVAGGLSNYSDANFGNSLAFFIRQIK